jgi:hypothetical protein
MYHALWLLDTWDSLLPFEQDEVNKLAVSYPLSFSAVLHIYMSCNRSYAKAERDIKRILIMQY